MHLIVQLAKKTVEEYVLNGHIISPPALCTDEMKEKAGVFVSLKKHGELRGCIGTFQPTTENIAAEIMQNAISAATQDPRFPPVGPHELSDIEYSVDILTEPEKIEDRKELDIKKYGIIVKSSNKKGLLLPDLEGISSVDEQISIAAMKAGIDPGETIELFRFEVKRYR